MYVDYEWETFEMFVDQNVSNVIGWMDDFTKHRAKMVS